MPLRIGDPAIDFTLPCTDGHTHSLSDWNDRPVLVVIFSCNHCPYAQAWEDRIIQLQAQFKPQGVKFAMINANDPVKYPADSFEEMKKRARAKGYNFPYLWDETQEVARAYGATRTPEAFVFDQERRLRYHGAIDDNFENPFAVKQHFLRDAIQALLQGKEPPVAETPPIGCTIKWK